MSHADWSDVLRLTIALVAAQRTPFQIFSWLGLAFGALMFVEGVRASFFPKRAVATPAATEGSHGSTAQQETTRNAARGINGNSASLSRTAPTRNSKKLAHSPTRQRFFRPGIRRFPMMDDPARGDDAATEIYAFTDEQGSSQK